MKRVITISLLLACGVCLALGCVKQQEPNTPGENAAASNTETQPEPAGDLPEEPSDPIPADEVQSKLADWLAVSPMRTKMLSMWVSCGEVNSMASGAFGVIEFDTLETNAGNIARTAKAFADMWEAIRNANRDMAAEAKAGDWFEARFLSQRVWKSCTDCHVENWSLATRGFLPETIDSWLEDDSSLADAPYGNLRLSSTPHYLQIMYRMVAYLDRAVGAIENNDAKIVLQSAQAMHEILNEQTELWRGVERHATKIADTAAKSDTSGIDRSYGRMIENCVACHEKYVQDARVPLDPIAWKYRRE